MQTTRKLTQSCALAALGLVVAGLGNAISSVEATSASPTLIGALSLPGLAQPRSMVAVGDFAYFGTQKSPNHEFFVIDVSDPRNPLIADSYEIDADVNAIAVQENLAFLATSLDDAELLVLNLGTGDVMGRFDANGSADGVSVFRAEPPEPYAALGTKNNPAHEENYIVAFTDPNTLTLFATREAVGSLANPFPPDPKDKGYQAGGTVIARARGEADPMLTFLAVQRLNHEFQVVSNLNDQIAVPDVNHDGKRQLACLGDSNTFPLFDKNPYAWPDYLRLRLSHPELVIKNYSALGAMMTPASTSEAQSQLQQAIAAGADMIIVAFGGNDVTAHTPEEINTAAQALQAQIDEAGLASYFATVIPRFDNSDWTNEIYQTNQLMRASFDEAHLIDFGSAIGESELESDQIHVNEAGMLIQGALVEERLLIPMSAPKTAAPSCGVGAEQALLIPVFLFVRRRTQKKPSKKPL